MIWLLPILNLIAGRGWFTLDKFICRCVLMPAIVCMEVGAGSWLSAAIFAAFALWAVPGHGKYFSAFHGRDDAKEREIGWIDSIGYMLYPLGDNYARGRFCMGLRGMFLYPLFLFLSAPAIGLGMFLQGWCYGIGKWFPEKYGAVIGEAMTGLLIATLVRLTHV